MAGQNVSDDNQARRIHVLESSGAGPTGPYPYRNRLSRPG